MSDLIQQDEFQLRQGPRCFVNAATGEEGRMFYERIPVPNADKSKYSSVINAGYAVVYNPETGRGRITLTVRHKLDEFSKKHAVRACLYRLNKGEAICFTLKSLIGGIVTTNECYEMVSMYLEDPEGISSMLKHAQLSLVIDKSDVKVSELVRIRAAHRYKAYGRVYDILDSLTKSNIFYEIRSE